MSADKLKQTLADTAFQKREQTLSLVTMYFLTMHERCHVALDHGSRLSEIRKLAEPEKSLQIQRLEDDADRCAIDIVNRDEARAKGSPISFFGALIIVATQAIVSARPALSSAILRRGAGLRRQKIASCSS
ncbi:MAG: hypothetical protein QOF70_3807 [Acetobacteraceae bacterium]|jgi:hypothetical protein|nr:hypothetical protein [Acetobacteraceae bacterium]